MRVAIWSLEFGPDSYRDWSFGPRL